MPRRSQIRVRALALAALCFCGVGGWSSAETTPMDTPLPEGETTLIRYEHTQSERVAIPGRSIQSQVGTYEYGVYIPAGYNDPENAELAYPVLFLCNGGGTPNMASFKDWVDENRWIVVMVNDARNGPWEPIFGAFLGAHDDAMRRLRIRNGLKFAAGASGGAKMTGYGIVSRPGFLAWMPFIGGADDTQATRIRGLVIHSVFGRQDEVCDAEDAAHYISGLDNLRHKFTTHAGGHDWGDPETVGRAMTWVRDEAMSTARLSAAETEHYLAPLLAEYENPATLIGRRHVLAKQIVAVAKRARLHRNEAWGEKIEAMEAFILSCRRELRDEIRAYDKWQTTLNNRQILADYAFIGEVSAAEVPALERRFDNDIQEIIEDYPDTQVGQLLAQR